MASADKHAGSHKSGSQGGSDGAPRKAGAFDIRIFIGSLIGIYGLVLVLMGLFGTSDSQLAKSDNLNINLWAGLGMVVVAAGFFLWARLRPVIVPADPDAPTVNDA
jgi:hypothetical protein